VLHQALDIDRWVVDVGDRCSDHLPQVVRGNVCRHADGNARAAVDEQVREPGGQDKRLLASAVVRGREVDRVLVEVPQQLRRQTVEARLGVAHGGCRVTVDVPEVPVPVHKGITHREVLREADERVVDRCIAVGVVLAHHLADDLRALDVFARGPEPELVHHIQDTPVNWFQSVADMRKRTTDDHRHRVVEIGGAHLLLEPARLDVAAADRVDG
jgi:hypothetical protein